MRWNDEDGGDDSYYDIDHDPQMTCLLHRLRREHAPPILEITAAAAAALVGRVVVVVVRLVVLLVMDAE